MHWKTREKILSAIKVYITEDDCHEDCCTKIRIQLPSREFVIIDLDMPMPKRIEYYSLEPSGFGNAVNVGPRIILYSKSKTLQILRNSLLYQNSDTVQVVIDLIQEMNDLRR